MNLEVAMDKIAQWVRALVAKPDDLNLISKPNMVKGENKFPQVILEPLHVCLKYVHVCIQTF